MVLSEIFPNFTILIYFYQILNFFYIFNIKVLNFLFTNLNKTNLKTLSWVQTKIYRVMEEIFYPIFYNLSQI